MADIELVINIPEEAKQAFDCAENNDLKAGYYDLGGVIGVAIKNGVPLPKGHGRLGDLDKIKKEMQNYYDDCAKTSEYTRLGFETAMAVVEDALAIIETDK